MFPEAYKAGVLASQIPTSTVGDFEVVRPTSVDRINKDGQVESVPPNVPVLDYSDGGCPKLLTGADDSITGAGDSSTFNSESGVLFADVKFDGQESRMGLSDGSADNRILFYTQSANQTNSMLIEANNNGLITFFSNVDSLTQNKLGFRYLNEIGDFYVNGINMSTKSIGGSFVNLNSYDFQGQGQSMIGKTKSIQHFDALTDQELEELTGYDSYDQMVSQFNFTTL